MLTHIDNAMKGLIINADGFGFAEGVTRAIEECIRFGTVRSVSANVNFPSAGRLPALVRAFPELSVGCHLNPIVGEPVSPPGSVPSLLDADGKFWYRAFRKRLRQGLIQIDDLRRELRAQVVRARDLAGDAFTHLDFHMGLHRLPQVYPIFLEIAATSGIGRIRTHKYLAGMEASRPALRHATHLLSSPARMAKYLYNMRLRRQALQRGLAMPDAWVEITAMNSHPDRFTVENVLRMFHNLPEGIFECVVHPGYVDDDLRRWSTYLEGREQERTVLLSPAVRDGLAREGIRLMGYRDIPLRSHFPGGSR